MTDAEKERQRNYFNSLSLFALQNRLAHELEKPTNDYVTDYLNRLIDEKVKRLNSVL